MERIYNDPKDPGSFGGVDRLHRRVVESKIKRSEVEKFLADQHSYSLHKPARKHFSRVKTRVGGVDEQWQADLADMQSISNHNQNMRYILTVIDVFSKYAWAEPVKDKSGRIVADAFRNILQRASPKKPMRLQTDKGKEFFNKQCKSLFNSYNIEHFATDSDQKAAVVERFNRTLKTRIWTVFTSKETRRWTDILQDIVHSYNLSYHRTIKMTPEEAAEAPSEKQDRIWRTIYGDNVGSGTSTKQSLKKIKNDQMVRISKVKGVFDKGYLPNWSREHFVIDSSSSTPQNPSNGSRGHTLYKLKDYDGEQIKGSFYKEELQPIRKNKYLVEKIIRKRKSKAGEEYLIKWKDWPSKFNSWIRKEDFENVTK